MGRVTKITNHFVVEDLGVTGYTTSKNVYLYLNSKNVDLAEFKRAAIRYIGLSLSKDRFDDYISIYREVSEEFGIKINEFSNGEEVAEDTESGVEISGNDDVSISGNVVEVVEEKSDNVNEVDKAYSKSDIDSSTPKVSIEQEGLKKPIRTRRSASRTKNTKIGAAPNK